MMAGHEGYENQHHLIHVRGAGNTDHMDTLLLKAVQEGREGDVCSLIEQRADVKSTFQQNKTLLMIAAEKGYDNITKTLLSAGANVNAQDEEGRTSLMIAAEKGHENIVKATVRETNVNMRSTEGRTALMFAAENGHDKIVDILLEVGAEVNAEAENEEETALTLVREELVLMRLMQSSHKLAQKTSSMNEEDVRAELSNAKSVAGTDDVDLVSVIEKACPQERFSMEEIEELKRLLQRVPSYKTIREKLLGEGGYYMLGIKNPATREKIKHILRTIDQKVLSNILRKAGKQERRNGVVGMVEFMIDDQNFVNRLATLFECDENSRKFLLFLTEGGNVITLSKLIMQPQLATIKDELGNNLLNLLAVNNNLKGFLQKVQMSETICDWLKNCFKMDNKKGSSFLAVAVNNEQMTEDDILEVMKLMIDISDSEAVSGLCKKKDNRGESLLHVAVKKSMMKLMSKILSITPEAHKIKNNCGYNALHFAVQQKNRPMVKWMLRHSNFDVNLPTGNGETPLHLAAQLFQTGILTDLVRRGGDLSLKDKEDGHTPLHDCLQQVYFEGGHNEAKFITVWNTILEEAITWWSWKVTPVEQANKSEEGLQCKAVYYLRSCIQNDNGLSVLQYAADRGLVQCVQAMLTAENIFLVQDESETFETDVTNLCPEYFVETGTLYSKIEIHTLNSAMSQTKQNREETVKTNADDAAAEGMSSTRSKNQTEILKGGASVLGNDTNNVSQSKPSTSNHKEKDHEISFLEVLGQLKRPNIAGEILESIPMKKLCQLEWGVSQWFFLQQIAVHVILMTIVTYAISVSESLFAIWKWETIVLTVFVECYAVFTFFHGMINLKRRVKIRKMQMKTQRRKQLVKIPRNEKFKKFILHKLTRLFHNDTYEIAFAIFTFGGLLNYCFKPFVQYFCVFLVFAWLMLLVPLASFTRIYKMLSVLQYIVINIIIPWSTIYFIVTIGFASAIQLEFKQLSNITSERCIDGEPELTGFVISFRSALYELLVMTSNLDTNLKHVRSVACVFNENGKSATGVKGWVTVYAVISTVILLNMLIAIMSNAVTYGQQDKGWRQYRINQTLPIYFGRRSFKKLKSWFRGTMDEGAAPSKRNEYGIRYDSKLNRWYLMLDGHEVKKVRAKVWQYPLDKDM